MTTARVVAIVGRPNVGKSAIFNRLAGRRVSIVHAESGVTRDRVMREVVWDDHRFELIDTGGVSAMEGNAPTDEIESGIRQQVNAALDDASAVILVVDVTAGVTAADAEVAAGVRRRGCPIFVAANKCDHPGRDDEAGEFEQWGLPVFPVSALHNRGFEELMEQVVRVLPEVAQATRVQPLKVAVIGRPNVGKSSYINRLLRSDRVIVSNVPGTTRDSIDIPFTVGLGEEARHYRLVDTAGMRRPGKIDTPVEQFSRSKTEESIQQADLVVLVLDAREGPTAQDKTIAAMILKAEKGCVLLVNKWDLEETTQTRYRPELQRAMPFMAYCPVVFVSAKSGYNIRKSIETIDYVAAQVRTEIPTGLLNRTILDACSKIQPPSIGTKTLKIFYATQVGHAPIRIRIFVNTPAMIPDNYRAYLIRILRGKFGLEGAPLVLQFQSRR